MIYQKSLTVRQDGGVVGLIRLRAELHQPRPDGWVLVDGPGCLGRGGVAAAAARGGHVKGNA